MQCHVLRHAEETNRIPPERAHIALNFAAGDHVLKPKDNRVRQRLEQLLLSGQNTPQGVVGPLGCQLGNRGKGPRVGGRSVRHLVHSSDVPDHLDVVLDQLPVVHGVTAQSVLQLLDRLYVGRPALRVELPVHEGSGLVVQVKNLERSQLSAARSERNVLQCAHFDHNALRSGLVDHVLQAVPSDLDGVCDGDQLLHHAVSLHVPELGGIHVVAQLGVHQGRLGPLHVRAQAVVVHVLGVDDPLALVDHLVCDALELLLPLVPVLVLGLGVDLVAPSVNPAFVHQIVDAEELQIENPETELVVPLVVYGQR